MLFLFMLPLLSCAVNPHWRGPGQIGLLCSYILIPSDANMYEVWALVDPKQTKNIDIMPRPLTLPFSDKHAVRSVHSLILTQEMLAVSASCRRGGAPVPCLWLMV